MEHYLRRVEREGVQRVKMFLVIIAAYVLFWGPLFLVTLLQHPILGYPLGYEVEVSLITTFHTVSNICQHYLSMESSIHSMFVVYSFNLKTRLLHITGIF